MKKNDNLPLNYKEKNNSRISFICSVATLLILILLFHQLDYNLIRNPARKAAATMEQQRLQAEIEANTPMVTTATVIAVGDNLYHGSLLDSGWTDSGDLNYDEIYSHVLDEIQSADVAMIDQETVLTTDTDAMSGYPSFATPTQVGDSIMKAGFDVVESATNHIDDYGSDYIMQTLNFWEEKYPEVPVLGVHKNQEDAASVKTLEVNGITIAFLDYTYGTNNPGSLEGQDCVVDIFDKEKVASAIKKAKEVSDCIIFVAHWGHEDEPMPTEYEKQWAAFLTQQGVDVIIGGHPHVLQPYGRMRDQEGHESVVFYSLGNFVSGQRELPELLEGMACFTLEKTTLHGESTVRVLEPEVKPMVMHYNYESEIFHPYMLEDYTDELAAQHSVNDYIDEEFSVDALQKKFDWIMSINVEPSTNTNLLEVSYDWDSNMVDKNGNYVEDTRSISAYQYYEELYNSSDSDESEE